MYAEIESEKFEIRDGQIVLFTLARGDIGLIKELQYIRVQRIIDNY